MDENEQRSDVLAGGFGYVATALGTLPRRQLGLSNAEK
jgi:hypothetical protein